MAGAAILFWIVSIFKKYPEVKSKDMPMVFFAALFAIIFNQGVFVLGVSYTSPVDSSIMTTTTPIITLILSFFYLKEKITARKLIGVVIGMTGALLLILSRKVAGHGPVAKNAMLGDFLCLVAQLSFSIYLVRFRKLILRYNPMVLMKWMFLFSTIILLPFSFLKLKAISYSELSSQVYLGVIFIVLCGTFFSYLLMSFAQTRLEPTVISIFNYVQPVVATIIAVLVGMDTFGLRKIFPVLLVFYGVFLVTRNPASSSGHR